MNKVAAKNVRQRRRLFKIGCSITIAPMGFRMTMPLFVDITLNGSQFIEMPLRVCVDILEPY